MRNKMQKERGVSLIITFFILVIILAAVLAISTILYGEIKVIRNMGNSVVAFYAADSGVEKTLYYDRKIISDSSSSSQRGALTMNIFCPSIGQASDVSFDCLAFYSQSSQLKRLTCPLSDRLTTYNCLGYYTLLKKTNSNDEQNIPNNLNSLPLQDPYYNVEAKVSSSLIPTPSGSPSTITIDSTGYFNGTSRTIELTADYTPVPFVMTPNYDGSYGKANISVEVIDSNGIDQNSGVSAYICWGSQVGYQCYSWFPLSRKLGDSFHGTYEGAQDLSNSYPNIYQVHIKATDSKGHTTEITHP